MYAHIRKMAGCGLVKQGGKRKTLKKNGGRRKSMKKANGGRRATRKSNPWTAFVTKVYHDMKKKNPAVKFSDALKHASALKKKGQMH
jgi:hypothetical protein